MNHGVRIGCSAAQAFQVFQISPVHLGPSRRKSFSARIRTRQTEHLVPRLPR
jgi:hypothetical protein